MLSWISTKVSHVLLNVLAAGPVPRHIAFVMDGNRRYAQGKNMQVFQGHADGFQALRKVLEICMRLHIRCVTVYAFSIENFKRSKEEVDALMHLAQEKLTELCEQDGLLEEYGVRLNVLGKKELLPLSVQEAVQRAEDLTRNYDKAILNLCMPYTSRDEIATAIKRTIQSSLESDSDSITEADVDAHLMTSAVGSPPLDILVRTSGVRRLSDFLLWQGVQVQFVETYWPRFSLWDFVPIILDYQRKVWGKDGSLR